MREKVRYLKYKRQHNYPKSESAPSGVMCSGSVPFSNIGGVFLCSIVKPLADLLELCNDGQASLLLLFGLEKGKSKKKKSSSYEESVLKIVSTEKMNPCARQSIRTDLSG